MGILLVRAHEDPGLQLGDTRAVGLVPVVEVEGVFFGRLRIQQLLQLLGGLFDG
jgi:hypothetical protein